MIASASSPQLRKPQELQALTRMVAPQRISPLSVHWWKSMSSTSLPRWPCRQTGQRSVSSSLIMFPSEGSRGALPCRVFAQCAVTGVTPGGHSFRLVGEALPSLADDPTSPSRRFASGPSLSAPGGGEGRVRWGGGWPGFRAGNCQRRDGRAMLAAVTPRRAEPFPMEPKQRLAYSPISKRPPLALPDGARMVCWVIVNVEEWDIKEAMPRTVLTPPAGGAPMPDIPNWAWHEYGNRVGFWRMLEVLDRLEIRAVLALNGSCIGSYAPIAEAARERRWDFLGHGFIQKNMQKVENERETIRRTAEAIANFTGKRPRGWLGPGLTETWETPDLLAEEGYEYVADWVLDDQPVVLKTRSKPIVNVPYTQECNDV